MTRRSRRGAAALLVLALVPGLSACGEDGFDPATNMVTADNAAGQTKADSILARAVVLVKSKDAPASAMAGTLINRSNEPDTLTTIEIHPDGGGKVITLSPNMTLNPGQVVAMGTESHEPLTVTDNGDLKVGHFADVVLRFQKGGDLNLEVPVVVREFFYSAVQPATGTPAVQADRKLTNVAKKPAASSGAAIDATGTAEAATAATAATGATGAAAAGKSAVTAPTAKKQATRSTPARTAPAAKAPAVKAPGAAVPAAKPAAAPAGHDMAGMTPGH